MAMTSTLLVPGGWQILSGVNPYLAPINRAPPIIWVGLTLLLLVVAVAHAKARMRLGQAPFSEEHGWHFSEDWSPIQDSDWQQLSLNLGLGALSSARARSNYVWGDHCGVAFVLFVAPGRRVQADERGPESMIAFSRASSPAHIVTLNVESAEWEKFQTDNWIFLRTKTPQWVRRGKYAVRFVEEAYKNLPVT